MKVSLHVMTTSIRRREGVTVSDVPRGKYLGNLAGTRTKDEAEHFISCPTCGGWIDWRDLEQPFGFSEITARGQSAGNNAVSGHLNICRYQQQ